LAPGGPTAQDAGALMSMTPGKTLRQLWWAPLACFGLAALLSQTELLRQLEWRTLDWRTRVRTRFQPPPDPRIVTVMFDDDAEARLEPWPTDRKWHAQMVQVLALSKAKLIVWDVILDAMRTEEGDTAMAQMAEASAADAGAKVVVGAVTNADPLPPELAGEAGPTKPLPTVEGDIGQLVGEAHAVLPFPLLRKAALYGFVDAPRGSDGLIHEMPLVVRVGKAVYPSLALQALMALFDVPSDKVRVRLGDGIYLPTEGRTRRVPISAAGKYLVNYRYDRGGKNVAWPEYGYAGTLIGLTEVLQGNKPEKPPPDMAGKIAILGQIVTGRADAGPTPLGDFSPLPFMHANVINNVLHDDYARQVPGWLIWLAALPIAYLGMVFIASRSVVVLCSGAVLGMAGYMLLCVGGWIWASWWFDLTSPFIGFGALSFVVIGKRIMDEQRAKQEIKGMFGTYVSPQLVERMIASGQPPQLGGHEEEITAYFSDIQSFSTFSEMLPPDRLVELMNEYLTACTDIVQEEGGTLDKYIGDAVVAMFGAPIALPDHAFRACRASQRVHRRLDELRTKWRSEGTKWPAVVWNMRSRIGLNSGRCVVGNMGSRTRFNYTMMGDDVNLAARMESGAKSWGAYSMCTEATRRACEQHGGDRVVFRPLGRIVVKGRSQAVPIHEIVGLREHVTPTAHECVGVFTEALERYYARDWDRALAGFARSAQLEPHIPGQAPGVVNNPSLVYTHIVETYQSEPPPDGWDGVYVMKEK
jgi:adenylate cyclase